MKFSEIKYTNRIKRRDYSSNKTILEMPNLLEIQKSSFQRFLDVELEEIIRGLFPITSPRGKFTLNFKKLSFVEPNTTEERSRYESTTYDAPLFVDVEMINNETGEVKEVKKTKNSSGLLFGNIPLMTDQGTFIINGIEKFVISQIVRSPGAYILDKSQIKLTNSRKKNLEGGVCELLPYRGTLLLFNINENKKYIQINLRTNNRESSLIYPATLFLKAYGLNEDEIKQIYGEDNVYIKNTLENDLFHRDNILELNEITSIRKEIESELSISSDVDSIINKGALIDLKLRKLILELIKIDEKILDSNTKELQKERKAIIDKIITEKAAKEFVTELGISLKTLDLIVNNPEDFSYQSLLIYNFFSEKYYDLSSAGRYKVNRKLRISERIFQRVLNEDLKDSNEKILIKKGTKILKSELDIIKKHSKERDISSIKKVKLSNIFKDFKEKLENVKDYVEFERIEVFNNYNSSNTTLIGLMQSEYKTLCLSDILSIISYAQCISENIYFYDDIDHLGNKRLKLIHELLKNKLLTGIVRIEKTIREKLTIADSDTINNDSEDEESQEETKKEFSIKSIINTKPFQVILKEFFNSYQLIQFIDQQNPLSELTNKRRISAMGPGGISREDPNLDIRDVHNSHYGRICPIETPEGMNIGLIISLASYAKIDENGFIQTPYRKVNNKIVTNEIEWLTPLRDDEYVIADSSIEVDENNKIIKDTYPVRYRGLNQILPTEMIDYIDVTPRQVVSIATSLIPFLENDDANRALMGANMQRQAVPLINPKSPWVGTGSEFRIAYDSKNSIISDTDGIVTKVDGNQITIKQDIDNKEKTFNLVKYRKSNQNTCNNQTPLVSLNQKISKNDVIANGPAMENGELALGRNVLVGFSTWNGYNFEDAIVLSERLVQEDVYTSIHIDEYKVKCLQTKNGDEEITKEIPNISANAKKYLDSDGIIMVGAEVKEGDILVGKVSPKSQTELQAEEKLLESIFGKKSKSLKDSSLRVPHGGEGIVIGVKRFKNNTNDVKLEDDLLEVVKIYIAQKRKIQVGDKMAGRHGNKGIVSKIVPIADMPFLDDGRPLDVLLNPLGVPSRMNIGQILELHLGLCSLELGKKELLKIVFNKEGHLALENQFGIPEKKAINLYKQIEELISIKKSSSLDELVKLIHNNDLLIYLNKVGLNFDDIGFKFSTPVFDGVNKEKLQETMTEANIDWENNQGKFKVRDGITGDYFNSPISIGVMYMLKLDHMVDDKIHARSIGPYSKVSQQPLGGKSQNGGQRFGEMEVWALEAYGAAYNLHELLTIKSDDVRGRNLTYNAIVKGLNIPFGGTPESFKLLTKKMQGLGLCLDIIDNEGNTLDINNFISNEYDEEYSKNDKDISKIINEVDNDELFLDQISL